MLRVLDRAEHVGDRLAQQATQSLRLGEGVRPGHVPRALVSARARMVEDGTIRAEHVFLQILPGQGGEIAADERRILVQHRRVHRQTSMAARNASLPHRALRAPALAGPRGRPDRGGFVPTPGQRCHGQARLAGRAES